MVKSLHGANRIFHRGSANVDCVLDGKARLWLVAQFSDRVRVGAFANHANYVIIHDATHNLIFRHKSWNMMVAVLADLPNLTAGQWDCTYHLKHHSHQGDYEHDADLANHWEARLVEIFGARKAIWLALFPFSSSPGRARKRSRCGIDGFA